MLLINCSSFVLRFRELEREKIWSRIHLVPLLMAEGDRDTYRREQAALEREKEIMKDVKGWEVRSLPYLPFSCFVIFFPGVLCACVLRLNTAMCYTWGWYLASFHARNSEVTSANHCFTLWSRATSPIRWIWSWEELLYDLTSTIWSYTTHSPDWHETFPFTQIPFIQSKSPIKSLRTEY